MRDEVWDTGAKTGIVFPVGTLYTEGERRRTTMEALPWITAGLSVLCGVTAAVCQRKERWLGRFLWKTSASVLFCVTALLALWQTGNWRTACPILAALVFGLVGDIALAVPPLTGRDGVPRRIWLTCGLISFGVGHLLYLALFLGRSGWRFWPLLAAPIMPLVLCVLVRWKFCRPDPALKAGMYIYAAVVSTMAGAAVQSALMGGRHLWSAAALLFVLSDTALTRDTFPEGRLAIDPWLPFVVLGCYFVAQNLFALSILF